MKNPPIALKHPVTDDDDDDDRQPAALFPAGRPTVQTADAGAAEVASANASWVFFDMVTVSGISADGICHLTLEAVRHQASRLTGSPMKDCIVTGHLRFGLGALRTLKAAIEQIETIVAQPGPSVSRN